MKNGTWGMTLVSKLDDDLTISHAVNHRVVDYRDWIFMSFSNYSMYTVCLSVDSKSLLSNTRFLL